MICLLAYDIADDKRRRKVVKELEGSARRVQHSVFETSLPEGQLRRLVRKTAGLLSQEDGDSLLVYRLCAGCAKRREGFGRQPEDWDGDVIFE